MSDAASRRWFGRQYRYFPPPPPAPKRLAATRFDAARFGATRHRAGLAPPLNRGVDLSR